MSPAAQSRRGFFHFTGPRAHDENGDSIDLPYDTPSDPPGDRLSRSIRNRYWDGLTRTLDEKGLASSLEDEKTRTADGNRYLYVPHDDALARGYFQDVAHRHPDWKLRVETLPAVVTPEYVRGLDGRHGILTLELRRDARGDLTGTPYVVPGGRFNEMYGWDSYFIVLGLLHDGFPDLAKSIVDNFVYEVEHFGKVLNANRTYYLTRSQPPFLTSMALAVYERLPPHGTRKAWLRTVLGAAIRDYEDVWMGPDHLTETGLSRYHDGGIGPPPEVEPGRFDGLFALAARERLLTGAGVAAAFRAAYTAGRVTSPELDRFFRHDRAMRESGHDASYRLLGRCADLVTVDLNSLLYKTESDIAAILSREFDGSLDVGGTVQRFDRWNRRAGKRREAVTRLLWNEQRGMFFDFDQAGRRQLEFASPATLYPLWAGLASRAQASRVVSNAMTLLSTPGGIAGSTEESRGPITPARPQYQWDFPFGWAPHQMLAWEGLRRYHHESLARDLAYRWLYTLTVNAWNFNGIIAEKYDVMSRSAQVFAEYGNVGTTLSCVPREGFGWTNASYVIGRSLLTPRQRDELNRLVPPEWDALRRTGRFNARP